MSTKYSISPRERWRMQAETRPRFTRHALNRYDQRTPHWAVSPQTAYEQGIRLSGMLDLFADADGSIPDRAVYNVELRSACEWYGVVLLIRDNHVRTVYSLTGMEDRALQAYLEVVAFEEGLV